MRRRRGITPPARHAARSRKRARRARSARRPSRSSPPASSSLRALKAALEAFDRRASELAKLEVVARDAAPLLTELEARANACETRAVESRKARDEIKKALATRGARPACAGAGRSRAAIDGAARGGTRRASRTRRAGRSAGRQCRRRQGRRRGAARGSALSPRSKRGCRPRRRACRSPTCRAAPARSRSTGARLPTARCSIRRAPVTLHIEGIGTITIAPGQSDDVANDEADLAAHRAQLASLLQRAGATSLQDAERLLAERRDDRRPSWREATAQLKASAPEGVERLQRTHAELAAQAASLGAPRWRHADELETRAQELVESLGLAEEKLNEAAREERAAREELVGLRTRIAGHAEQIDYAARRARAARGAHPRARGKARRSDRGAIGAQRRGARWRRLAREGARRCALCRAEAGSRSRRSWRASGPTTSLQACAASKPASRAS